MKWGRWVTAVAASMAVVVAVAGVNLTANASEPDQVKCDMQAGLESCVSSLQAGTQAADAIGIVLSNMLIKSEPQDVVAAARNRIQILTGNNWYTIPAMPSGVSFVKGASNSMSLRAAGDQGILKIDPNTIVYNRDKDELSFIVHVNKAWKGWQIELIKWVVGVAMSIIGDIICGVATGPLFLACAALFNALVGAGTTYLGHYLAGDDLKNPDLIVEAFVMAAIAGLGTVTPLFLDHIKNRSGIARWFNRTNTRAVDAAKAWWVPGAIQNGVGEFGAAMAAIALNVQRGFVERVPVRP